MEDRILLVGAAQVVAGYSRVEVMDMVETFREIAGLSRLTFVPGGSEGDISTCPSRSRIASPMLP